MLRSSLMSRACKGNTAGPTVRAAGRDCRNKNGFQAIFCLHTSSHVLITPGAGRPMNNSTRFSLSLVSLLAPLVCGCAAEPDYDLDLPLSTPAPVDRQASDPRLVREGTGYFPAAGYTWK